MGKLIQLKLSDSKLKKYDDLVNKLGLKGTFGEYQKAIDLSIDFTLSGLQNAEKVLPDLEPDKLKLFLSSVAKLRKEREKADLMDKIANSE